MSISFLRVSKARLRRDNGYQSSVTLVLDWVPGYWPARSLREARFNTDKAKRVQQHMIHLPEISHFQSFGLFAIAAVGCCRYTSRAVRAFSDAVVCVIDEIGRIIKEFRRIRNEIWSEGKNIRGRSRIRLKSRRRPSLPQPRIVGRDKRGAGRKLNIE
jgi:hypothetical protein